MTTSTTGSTASEDTADSAPGPSIKALTAGQVVADRYRLERVIGQGGMAYVWRALDISRDLQVAVKLVRPSRVSSNTEERLRREAQSAALITHPCTVDVLDVGKTADGQPFIVMDFVEGESLAGHLDRYGTLAPEVAVALLLPIVGAIAAAHAEGITHRDIKPSNILVCAEGAPKLLDFGLAKIQPRRGERRRGRHITATGVRVGSPAYMSPEQIENQSQVDHRSDLWSLCVVLYECLGGRRPFRGGSTAAVLGAILQDDMPPLAAVDDVLRAIVSRGLSKNMDARWQSATALEAALADWLPSSG